MPEVTVVSARGRIPLSLSRRLICDYLQFARQVPSVPVQRRMRLGELVAARAAGNPPPSWCALFTKAYGFVAASTPSLRRAYMAFPRPHLYEHPINVASIAVERKFGDEDAGFSLNCASPADRTSNALAIEVDVSEGEASPCRKVV